MHFEEARSIMKAFDPAFEVLRPDGPDVPVIFNSPHSGRIYPKRFLRASKLDRLALRRSEDSFVDELFAHVPDFGAPLIHAHFPRVYLDVNREPYELDPRLIAGRLPEFANFRSLRVAGGLGTVARVVTENEEIYCQPLSLKEVLTRIERLHKPYHAALKTLILDAKQRFGLCILIDCHSMPSQPGPGHNLPRPDFVLGDRFGVSCTPELARLMGVHLKDMGYKVALNKPYAGGYITEHYGRPAIGIHAIQIEINRCLYMCEDSFEKARGFDALQCNLEKLTGRIIADLPQFAGIGRFAAE